MSTLIRKPLTLTARFRSPEHRAAWRRMVSTMNTYESGPRFTSPRPERNNYADNTKNPA